MAQILVTGMAGGLSQLIARRLLQEGHEVVGVDYRPVPPLPDLPGMITYRANYNKTAIEDVFRRHAFERVLHLGRVGNLKEDMGKRFDLNVVGSQKIMNLCLQYGIKRLLVLSTFHIYGASPANHIPIAEDEPLRAGSQFPQLADAIQLDNMAATWVYQHREVLTAVLRVTNVVGPSIHPSGEPYDPLDGEPAVVDAGELAAAVAALAEAVTEARHGGAYRSGVTRRWNRADPAPEAEASPTRPSASEGAWRR